MRTSHLYRLLLFAILIFPNFIFSQVEKIATYSDLIIEGRVISKKSSWNKEKTALITENKILVNYIFKGEPADSIISIVTKGGYINDIIQLSVHSTVLNINEIGYFFLSKEIEGRYIFNESENVFAVKSDRQNPNIIFNSKNFKENIFIEQITRETETPRITYSDYIDIRKLLTASDICDYFGQNPHSLTLGIADVDFDFSESKISFAVTAKSSTPGLEFNSADFNFIYPNQLGGNLVSSNQIQIEKGEIISSNSYQLNYNDENPQEISLNITSNNNNDLYIFNSSIETLAYISIQVPSLATLVGLNSESLNITGYAEYFCNRNTYPFGAVNFIGNGINNHSGSSITGITYTFENGRCNKDNTKFLFDIYAEADDPGELKYLSGFFQISYNSSGFFPNIISSGHATIEKSTLVNSSFYVLDASDLTDNEIIIFVDGNLTDCNDLDVLSNIPIPVLSVSFDISNPSLDKNIFFNQSQMELFGSFYCSGTTADLYDPLNAVDEEIGEICGCSDPIITDFTPEKIPAGMGEVLTINGQNFLDQDAQSKVFFKNGDDGGLSLSEAGNPDIMLWTNERIEIIVPGTDKNTGFNAPPSSGKFKIETRCGEVESGSELEIPYCILSNRGFVSEKIAMKDDLCIGFSSDIPVWARNTFKSAVDTWCSKVNMNIKVDYLNDASINQAALDGISLVSNEEASSPGGIASLVIANNVNSDIYIETCAGTSNVFKEVDIRISDQALNGSMQSLLNVLLHELGHVLMLNHSDNVGITLDEEARYIMYYDQTNLNANNGNRSIKQDDEEGARKIFSNSAEAIQNCGGSPITMGTCGVNCGTTSLSNIGFSIKAEIFPNPNNGNFEIIFPNEMLQDFEIKIYSVSGVEVYSSKHQKNEEKISLSQNFTSGIYVVEIMDYSGGYWASKFLIE